jgi:formate hydrogenlyase subunit 4
MTIALAFFSIVILAPLVQGIMRSLRARLQGRIGPSPLQPYRDLFKLLRKEALLPEGTSTVVAAAPGVMLGVSLTLAALIFSFDPVAIALTLALGRFILLLAALDTRSSFEGMAASREATFAALTEAPLILAIAAAAIVGDHQLPRVLAAAAMLLVLLSETARIPVDNQETHYELTMIHEGLILEYSGWQLALLNYAAQVRQLALLSIAAMMLPGNLVAPIAWIAGFVAGLPMLEASFAKLRLFEVPPIFAAACILAVCSLGVSVVGLHPW